MTLAPLPAPGSLAAHTALGLSYDAFLAADAGPTSAAEKADALNAMIAHGLNCGLAKNDTTPIAWIERRLSTFRAAAGLDTRNERIAA